MIYYFITIYLYIFLFFYSFLILYSFLLHFSTFLSFFDLFLCLNFVLPISPTALYYFKCYPNWLQVLREERQRRPKKKKFKSLYFVFAVVSLKCYGFI